MDEQPAGRIRYLMRRRPGDAKLAQRQANSVVRLASDLVGRIQAAKHASTGNVAAVRSHLISIEALLHRLFAVDDWL